MTSKQFDQAVKQKLNAEFDKTHTNPSTQFKERLKNWNAKYSQYINDNICLTKEQFTERYKKEHGSASISAPGGKTWQQKVDEEFNSYRSNPRDYLAKHFPEPKPRQDPLGEDAYNAQKAAYLKNRKNRARASEAVAKYVNKNGKLPKS